MARKGLLMCFSLVLAVATAQFAQAGFVTGPALSAGTPGYGVLGTGSFPDFADGTVNFAVYQRTDGNWTNDAALAGHGAIVNLLGAGVDTSALYVYFYQIVNDDPVGGGEDDPLLGFHVTLPGTSFPITSAGYLTSTLFTDVDGTVGVGNPLGADNTGVNDPAVDGTASKDGQAAPGITSASGAVPLSVTLNLAETLVRFNFDEPGNTIPIGSTSTIVYFTSDYRPEYLRGNLVDNGSTTGDVPSLSRTPGTPVVPEPSTYVVMIGSLLAGTVAVVANRFKKNA